MPFPSVRCEYASNRFDTDNTRKVSRKQIKRYAGLLTRELDHFIVIPGKKLPPLIEPLGHWLIVSTAGAAIAQNVAAELFPGRCHVVKDNILVDKEAVGNCEISLYVYVIFTR